MGGAVHVLAPAATQAKASVTPARPGLLQRCGDAPCGCGCDEGVEDELLQRSAAGPEPGDVPAIVHDVLGSLGRPLDAPTRASMEASFGHDFSRVRVHADARAGESARAVGALAYTVGSDIVFGPGRYAPDSTKGGELLAHELAHVVQQRGRDPRRGARLAVDPVGNPFEQEAKLAALVVAEGRTRPGISSRAPAGVMRQAGGAPPAAPAKTYAFSITTDGCDKPPYTTREVARAAQAAFDKVLNANCVHSESLREDILEEFDGLEIDCESNGDEPCGMASRYFTQTVNIYPKALDPARCGPLESTILHEVVHLTEWRLFGHGDLADACEKSCFGYGPGDASKCK